MPCCSMRPIHRSYAVPVRNAMLDRVCLSCILSPSGPILLPGRFRSSFIQGSWINVVDLADLHLVVLIQDSRKAQGRTI